ncbi:hypothetical protein ACO0LD_31175 [Undibacterium sp. Ji83W]|uniref:hypothetical protein n=1 Tax=Undibacterium sp. Ji83W TaxID=3413043 RepID=UPI003BF13C38
MQSLKVVINFFGAYRSLPGMFFAALMSMAGCSNAVESAHIFTGTNGPTKPQAYHFESRSQLDNSWVKSALSSSDYEQVLSKIDFRRQILVAVSVGERNSVSENVQLWRIRLLPVGEDTIVDVSVKVGMVSKECRKDFTSYVFVLGTFEKPKQALSYGSYDMDNFNAGCVTELSGQAKVGNPPAN